MRLIIDDGDEQSFPKEETIKVDKIISVRYDLETERDIGEEEKHSYQCFRYTGFEDIKIRVTRKRVRNEILCYFRQKQQNNIRWLQFR